MIFEGYPEKRAVPAQVEAPAKKLDTMVRKLRIIGMGAPALLRSAL